MNPTHSPKQRNKGEFFLKIVIKTLHKGQNKHFFYTKTEVTLLRETYFKIVKNIRKSPAKT